MTSRTDKNAAENTGAENKGAEEQVADAANDAVDDNPWLERVTQIGWIAKGVVYTFMGVTAFQIAQQDQPTDQGSDDASPQGSIGRIAEAPFGRVLLAVLTVGLILYAAWRLLSVAIIRGHELRDWADRVGYTFSAIFYLLLAYTAGKAAISGVDPEESNSVESLSKSLLETTAGRWILGIGGVATMAVGAFFVIHKGLQRSFVDDLDGVSATIGANRPKRKALVIAGIAGWVGRGLVTIMVGFFVVRAAVRFDPNDARGFDRALRQVAGTGVGSALVVVSAIGLILYGLFCFFSHRVRSLETS